MVIKIIGLGLKNYIRDPFNLFDALLVVLSLMDFVLFHIKASATVKKDDGLNAFRAVRLLRIFKLVRSWTTLQELL